jgi:hypothetical protein
MNSNNNFKIPGYAKGLLGLVAAVIGLYFAAVYGFVVIMIGMIAFGIVADYLPNMVVACAFAGAIGAVISQKRSGTIGSGIWAGIFYALLGLGVGVLCVATYAAFTYRG